MELFGSFWEDEFEDLELADERINLRLISMLSSMSAGPGRNLNNYALSKRDKKAGYRLLDNSVFCTEEVLQSHYEKTAQRCQEHDVVFLIQDTTGFNFDHPSTKGLGRIGGKLGRNKIESKGLFSHNTLAYSETGAPLGLLDLQMYSRAGAARPRNWNLNQPIQTKSSYRWIKSLNKDEFFSKSKTRFIVLADREGDFGALQGSIIDRSMDFVIRVKESRVDQKSSKNLRELFNSFGEHHILNIDVENRTIETDDRRNPKKKRYLKEDQETEFRIKYRSVEMKVESEFEEPRTENLFAIKVEETRKRPGKKLISWTLLTTLPINSFEDANRVVEYYRTRWKIEVYHKIQKSVCKIEKSALRTSERLKRFIVLQSLVAFGVCRLKYLLNCEPDDPAENHVSKETVEILKRAAIGYKHQGEIVTIKDFVFMLANLEGYTTFKLKTPPGAITLGNAVRSFNYILRGYDMAQK